MKHKIYARNDGNKDIVTYVGTQARKFDKVLITYNDQMPIYYLFFNNLRYRNLTSDDKDPVIAFQINNVYFVKDWCATIIAQRKHLDPTKKYLLIDGGNCVPTTHYYEQEKITRSDGTLAFTVYKN